MAPLHIHQLKVRQIEPSGIFSIVLGSAALSLLLLTFMWACFVPWLRTTANVVHTPYAAERSAAGGRNHHPTSTQWTFVSANSASNSRIPPRHMNECQTQPRIYDPRIESPFKEQPQHREAFNSLSPRPRPEYARVHRSLDVRETLATTADPSISIYENRTRELWTCSDAPSESYQMEGLASGCGAHSISTNHVAAMPEALFMRSQHPGSLPALRASFQRTSRSFSDASALDVHPKKLFERLSSSSGHVSSFSDPSRQIKTTDDANSHHPSYINEVSTCDDLEAEITEEREAVNSWSTRESVSIADMSAASFETVDSIERDCNKSVAALHRLRTYRSLVDARPPRPLTRAGTLTRPKTPVAEIRNFYDRVGKERTVEPTSATTSNSLFAGRTATAESSERAPSTTFTSVDVTTASSGMRPTPLKIRTSIARIYSSVKATGNNSQTSVPLTVLEATQILNALSQAKRLSRHSHILQPSHKNKHARHPAPLSPRSTTTISKRRTKKSSSVSFASNFPAPLVARNGFRCSSVYSRDTRGIGSARGSIAPYSAKNTNFFLGSPFFPVNNSSHSVKDDKEEPMQTTSSSRIVNARQKIDNWNCHVGEVTENLLQPLCNTERASEIGSVSESCSMKSGISTELNGAELEISRTSIPRIGIRESTKFTFPPDAFDEFAAIHSRASVRHITSDSALTLKARGCAPGGASWL